VASVRFNTDYNPTFYDHYSHGSHMAGIVGGNGRSSNGQYMGIAPKANVINVKVSNDDGSATASSAVAGLQWVLNNHSQYNIRVVNLSLNSAAPESYHTSPLDAAVEVLWFHKIVVVVSAGNNGTAMLYPPANDPFVITVGAVDDKGTASLSDDVIASFSAYGTTGDGVQKPDLVAPGKNIVSLMGDTNGIIPSGHPGNKVGTMYFRMSGTSTSAPIVSGAAALLLQDEPNLTPDQVKYRLKATANKSWAGYTAAKAGAGTVNVYAAIMGTTTQSANTNIAASRLLWTGPKPLTWGSVSWDSVSWDSVSWDSVSWDSVSWDSVSWDSDYWGP
jgi:serine protease AprX